MAIPVGIIGAGRWAEVHRQALAACGAELVGVLVRSDASAARVAQDWQVPVSQDMATFLSWPSQAVIVVSPNYLHAEHSLAALAAGKHVLVEKPMATRLEDCQAMEAAAAQAGKVLAVGLEMRVFRLFARVKELQEQGSIGAPLHLKLDLWRRPYRSGAGGWKTDMAKLGSPTLEEPVHYLDLARWYFAQRGEVRALEAWANSRRGREAFSENLEVRLEFDGGRAWVTRSVAAYGHSVRLQLVGEQGALEASWRGAMDMDENPEVRLTLHNDSGTQQLDVPSQTGHAFDVPKQTQAFLQAISQGSQPAATAADGTASVKLCYAVDEALRQAKVIYL